MKLKDTAWKKSYDQTRQHIKKERHYFANKGPSSQSYGFSSSHVCMWELNYKGSWVPKNWCFWTVVLEKTLESPSDFMEIQPVHPKGVLGVHWKDWCWSWISNTWPPHGKSWLIGKDGSWCWEGLRAGREGDDRGWNDWMASLTRWTWVWVNSGSWWCIGRPGLLWFVGSQRVGHDWATELKCGSSEHMD